MNQATHPDDGIRVRAASISLAVGVLLLFAKYTAYRLTNSAAILSDALESIVNVVAALFALGGLVFAGRPADRNHPYGHGKIEFFSAVFEGGMIAFAAVLILYEALRSLVYGNEVQDLDLGLAITFGAGLANLALGKFLVKTGTRVSSLALIADGKHVIADFWTSLGVVVGLALVWLTDILWLDGVVAAIVGVNLAWEGGRLVREAAGGLLDEEDTPLLEKLIAGMNSTAVGGIVRIHRLRAIRSGRFHHVDAHLVVPEFWTVHDAHEAADAFEREVISHCGIDGEINFHTDPCRRLYCASCTIEPCPIRAEPFRERSELTTDEAVQPDRPLTT